MKVIPSVDPLDPNNERVYKVPKEYEILYDPEPVVTRTLASPLLPCTVIVGSQVHHDRQSGTQTR